MLHGYRDGYSNGMGNLAVETFLSTKTGMFRGWEDKLQFIVMRKVVFLYMCE